MFKRVIFCSVVFTFLVACESSKPAASSALASASNTSTETKMSAVLWQQTAAEYEALCYQSFTLAKQRISSSGEEQVVDSDGSVSQMGKPNVIIMDLDETVLDNSPYQGLLLMEGKEFNRESWEEWVKRADAELIPGALDFIQLAEELNISIFYISNREEYLFEPTFQNLTKYNIRVDREHLLLKTEEDNSKEARRIIAKEGFDNVLFIGDNLADFNAAFEGEQNISQRKNILNEFRQEIGVNFILLPNVMYGDWEDALERDDKNAFQNVGKGGYRFLKRYH